MKLSFPRLGSWMLTLVLILAIGFHATPLKADANHSLKAFFADHYAGRILSARAGLQRELDRITDLDDRITLLDLILQDCALAEDDACVKAYTREIIKIPVDSGSTPIVNLKRFQYVSYWISYDSYLFVDLDAHRDAIFGKLIDTGHEEPQKGYPIDGRIFIKRQFLCTRMYLELNEFANAQRCLDKALAHLVAIRNAASLRPFILDSVTESVYLLLELGELDRARGIFAAISGRAGLHAPQSLEYLRYRLLQADVFEQLGNLREALRAIEIAARVEKGIEISAESRAYFQSQIYLRQAALCVINGNVECAVKSLDAVPFHLEFEASGRPPQNQIELNYLAVRALTAAAGRQETDRKVLNVLKAGVEFEVPGVPPEMLSAVRNVALGLSQEGSGDRAALLLQASRDLIAAVRSKPATALGSWYRAGVLDRAILMLALLGQERPSQAAMEPIFLAMQMLSRHGTSSQMDALGTLAAIDDGALRKGYQRSLRFRAARDKIERNRVAALLRDAAGEQNGTPAKVDGSIRIGSEAASEEVSRSVANSAFKSDRTGLIGLRSFQATLRENEAALYLAPTFNSQLAFMCVRRNEVRYTIRQTSFAQFDRDERLLRAALTATHAPTDNLDRQFPAEAAVRLHDQLIKPFEPCLRAGDTIQWMSGAYHLRVPLAVLLREMPPRIGNGFNLAKARWLALDHAISYAGSAALLKSTRRKGARHQAGAGFLGIGDPLLDGRDQPTSFEAGQEPWRREINKLKRLPESRDELVRSASAFPQSSILLGAEATEAAFRRQPGSFRYLSFATHAVIRDDAPGLPSAAIVLTGGSNAEDDDGLLTTDEIAALDLNAEFVALSACNTAHYDFATFADEVPALGLAFALAGVPATLATLWPVDSHTSREIVSSSFQRLARGGSPSSALGEAQRAFLAANSSTAHFHPRFWAPFIILGDGARRHTAP